MIFVLTDDDTAINVMQIVSASRNADGTWRVELADNKEFTLSPTEWNAAIEMLREIRGVPSHFVFNGTISST